MKFQNVSFIKTVVRIEDLPFFADLPEIAVVGRSNVGKSTLLNHLFGLKNFVKTSSTPGKTRALNFFKVDNQCICVDMPGYGYAAVAKNESHLWGRLVENYLTNRSTLKTLLFLFDIRRTPSEEDYQMLEWIHHYQLPTILVLTKADKVNQSERNFQTKMITGQLTRISHTFSGSSYTLTSHLDHQSSEAMLIQHYPDSQSRASKQQLASKRCEKSELKNLPYIHYSATKNEGRKELIAMLRKMGGFNGSD